MNRYSYKRKFTALFFLIIFGINTFAPATVYALTSGPKQPEMGGFQPAGASDMVDVFSGDFKYNIPLLDVDGYPVNINYQSGVGMDDEASWVGLGWNLNVGSLNRQLRGLPDDFNGDEIITDQSVKPEITAGGRMNLKAEIVGNLSGLEASLNGSLMLGIFTNSYTGIGAEVGGNAGFSLGMSMNKSETLGLGINGGIGITSSTSTGVNVNPQLSMSVRSSLIDNLSLNPGMSASLGYNTRGGYQSLQLGYSFSVSTLRSQASFDMGGSEYFFNTSPFYPKPNMEFNNYGATFNANVGGMYYVFFSGMGATAYVNAKVIKNKSTIKKGFGFLYAQRGKSISDALMDYKRELDNPIIPELPNLAIPVHTPDIFSFSSQTGGGQFRLYRGGTGVFFNDKSEEVTKNGTIGFDFGVGGYFHGGISHNDVETKSINQKWNNGNTYNSKGDFQENSSNPNDDPVFFKQVGEKTAGDLAIETAFQSDKPVAVKMSGKTAEQKFRFPGGVQTISSSIIKQSKAKKKVAIGYLTAAEATKGGLYKNIYSYPVNNADGFQASQSLLTNPSSILRSDNINRKSHHISEFTVTNETGQRLVYGTPVYNLKHEEYLFNVGTDIGDGNNLVDMPLLNGQIDVKGKGVDEYFFKQKQPAYATGYMLDAILSPDYVDVTGNGISDDDLGSYVKFNYSKLESPFKWRTPFDKANINRGKLADADDNKGAITYGEKELWYLHSIETKTKVAFFLLEDRQDALGVIDWKGGKDATNKQKKLKEIRLFSKSDYTKPIKTIVFNYKGGAEELCQGIPNREGSGGKLTLAGIQMIYGNDRRALNIPNSIPAGKIHEYKFQYGNNASYAYMSNDRWGTYKPKPLGLKNDEFPYTDQTKSIADGNASQLLLNQIELPTGGTINVEYEADDYGYVQNKKAMLMKQPANLIKSNGEEATSGLEEAQGVQIQLDQSPPSGATTTDQLKKWLLNGDDFIYGKLFTNISDKPGNEYPAGTGKFDFVSCYAKIDKIERVGTSSSVNIFWENIIDNGKKGTVTANPFSIAAWQKMRMEYPQYAYPGYENRIKAGDDPGAALKAAANAFLNAFKNLREISENFYQRCKRKHFGNDVTMSKSFFRIAATNGYKMGGGVRVKKIKMNNNWATMSGSNENASYGMAYDYTTTDEDGTIISSGVASYEPAIGNDENPLRQPVPYIQSIKGALNNLWYLEKPFGESYFPAPSIGYSKVTVRNLDESGNPDPENETGWTTSEFYTAKEFPTIVKTTDIEKYENGPRSKSNLFGGFMLHELVLSQGYALYLNDMHGKPKADFIYDKSGTALSGSKYLYHSKSVDNNQYELVNNVKVINQNGVAEDKILGRDIELFTDMQESEYSTYGKNTNIGIDISQTPWGFPPPFIPIPHWPRKNNDEYRLFRSACAVKVIQQFGLIEKVIKLQNGSTIEAENLAYDAETGEVLVSKTHNEFKDTLYSVNIPAYWIQEYEKMSGAYKTLGTYLKGFGTDANGLITNSSYNSFLQAGDELLDLNPAPGAGKLMWVVENIANGQVTAAKRIVDAGGALIRNYTGTSKIIRSGYRNLFSMAGMSITSLKNPIENDHLVLSNSEMKDLMVLDSKAIVYTENWDGVYAPKCVTTCNTFCQGNEVSLYSKNGAIIYQSGYSVNGTGNVAMQITENPFWTNSPGNCSNLSYQSINQYDSVSSQLNTQLSTELSTASTLTCNISPTERIGLCGPLNRTSIWVCIGNGSLGREPVLTWVTFSRTITIPVSKIYYVGLSGDNMIKFSVDGNPIICNTDINNFETWKIYPLFLTAGQHEIILSGYNYYYSAAIGCEIYNNTAQEIAIATDYNQLNPLIYTTRDEIGATAQISYVTCPNGYLPTNCTDYSNCIGSSTYNISKLNPYTKGFKGNWRPVQSQVFQVNRSYGNNANPNQQGINIAKDGFYSNYTPYWVYSNESFTRATTNAEKWVAANTMTLYDQYGQELENKDALNRYSSASFSFKGNTASLVASNAMHREVFYESFEDKNFRSAPDLDSCGQIPFSFDNYLSSMNAGQSHSGKYSLQLNNSVSIHAKMYDANFFHNPITSLFGHNYITTNANGEYEYFPQAGGKYNNGFEPIPGKRYVMSCWMKDGGAMTSLSIPATITFSGADWVVGGVKIKARVEGWKLVEGVFQTQNTTTFSLNISGGASTWIDDLRIHPYNAQMKTYAYDERTLRLMAELDENNFAAFYEYDQEGILNRVKKETEKGIKTIKETRSTYKRGN